MMINAPVSPLSAKILTAYSRRRHQVMVMNQDGDMLFYIDSEDLDEVANAILFDDDKLKSWVIEDYSDAIEHLLQT